ncbi:MAG TPA: universal stress protein [Gemmatimonadales bacterium]|nr:universal stress protein [Gemmatimonadales bacterium]
MLLRHIVVATDESPAGQSAVRAGLDLAQRAFARLTVMRVVPAESVPLLGTALGGVVGPDGAASALERLQRWLHAELRADAPVPVELGIAFGVPGIEICRFAEQRGADLLVLGRKHRSAVARLLVGDTADAVVRRSRVPCLFVENGALPLSQLLVALDGSDRGMRVYAAARDFARAVDLGLTVVTVECGDEPAAVDLVPPLPLTRSSRLWRELEPAASRSGAPTSSETAVSIRQGRPVAEVLAEVAKAGADVLTFGCHRGGPAGILESGGVARHLLHGAPVSVLTIPL